MPVDSFKIVRCENCFKSMRMINVITHNQSCKGFYKETCKYCSKVFVIQQRLTKHRRNCKNKPDSRFSKFKILNIEKIENREFYREYTIPNVDRR
jgi:hypothetical protein